MTIKEVEERTGLTRSNIRFYEKEGLIQPRRNEQNGYRAYSEADVTTLGRGWMHTPIVTEYLTNFLCFVLLSVETFTLLYLAGAAGDVHILLFVDAAAGLGMLALGLTRMGGRAHP